MKKQGEPRIIEKGAAKNLRCHVGGLEYSVEFLVPLAEERQNSDGESATTLNFECFPRGVTGSDFDVRLISAADHIESG